MRMKRWLAALLAIVLCLGMVAVCAVADTSAQPLYARFLSYDQDADRWYLSGEERADKQWITDLGNNSLVVFSTDEAGEHKVPVSQLQCSGDAADLSAAAGNFTVASGLEDYAVLLSTEKIGEAVVSYTNGSDCYTFDVEVILPRIGFFSTSTRSETSFLNRTLPYYGGEQTIYLLPREGFNITGVETDTEMNFFTAVVLDNGTATVTLSEGFEENCFYGIRVSFEGEFSGTQYMSIQILDQSPGLLVRDINLNGDSWTINNNYSSRSFSCPKGYSQYVAVLFVKDGVETPLPLKQLTFPDLVKGERMQGEADYFLKIQAKEFGTGAITYTRDGETYSLPVEVSLPSLGFYSGPVASEENYLDSITGEIGSKQTAYLVWDSDLAPVQDPVVTLYPDGGSGLIEMKLDDTRLAEYGISLTQEENDIRIDATIDSSMMLLLGVKTRYGYTDYSSIRIRNSYAAKLNQWNEMAVGHPVLTYDGVEYTFGLGKMEYSGEFNLIRENVRLGYTAVDADSACSMDIALGAMASAETEQETVAPLPVNTAITVTKVEILDYINTDDLEDQEVCNLTATKLDNRNALGMPQIHLQTEAGGFVQAMLLVSFTVQFPGQEPVSCQTSQVFNFSYTQQLELDLSEVDTTQELNQLLGSKASFEAWMKENDSENYRKYKAYQSISSSLQEIDLLLPAVTYDGLVEVGLYGDDFDFNLIGTSGNGKQTTIHGLWVKDGGGCGIRNISFVADENVKVTYGNETFTCGIFAYCENNAEYAQGDVYGIENCSFTGFDYGVRGTSKGFACASFSNYFSHCKVGFLMDCGGKNAGRFGSDTSGSTFEHCGTAIEMRSLPSVISPYQYRIYECNFINNDLDISSGLSARLYCYRNYFGAYTEGGSNVLARPSRTRGLVITNPRYLYPIYSYNQDALALSLDPENETEILNHEADSLTMDADALAKEVDDADGTVSINVLDEDEQVQAVWTFGEE